MMNWTGWRTSANIVWWATWAEAICGMVATSERIRNGQSGLFSDVQTNAASPRQGRHVHPRHRTPHFRRRARTLVSAPTPPWKHDATETSSRQTTSPPEEEGHQPARQPAETPIPDVVGTDRGCRMQDRVHPVCREISETIRLPSIESKSC